MVKLKSKYILLSLIFSLILLTIGFLVALLISRYYNNMNIGDVMFFIGLGTTSLGALTMLNGSPSGADISKMGCNTSQYDAFYNLESLKISRKPLDYIKNFKQNSVIKLTFSGLTMILGGILSVLFSTLLNM
ncbi:MULTISPECIES: hypothetical protein [Clostridium]|uniref:DUF3899 domain-containing protein n=2 Tax=Clostridium TaxID=1485 RepID=A0A151ARC0_9CLOT|nr:MULTISPECIES: hypothetical protein [Clostridium]KYH30194.1 hypothetical protein CLCOL_01320 [Clostridium colicanis DSM 13634]MBE6044576.1 hypothetical protein [Clostridium thermopalmarium]PRR76691.1 hypothetical protein CPAL_00760 [Clostridium thermopalmarium DSM 5974]PVZ23026.1 hypothetical protein LX19_01683 [Clostridium thermopalmarium DSM 5974]